MAPGRMPAKADGCPAEQTGHKAYSFKQQNADYAEKPAFY